MNATPDLVRRLAVCACLLLLAAPVAAQDEGDDDGGWGTGGTPTIPTAPMLPGEPPLPPLPDFPGSMGGGTGGGTGSDAPLGKRRQWTSLQLLRWDWDYGYAPGKPGAPPLARKVALSTLASQDQRPLLVIRECAGCKRDDHKLVEQQIGDDKTVLLGRWFHQVRVSDDVLEKDHPFHGLFEGNSPAHLFAATVDGAMLTEVGPRMNLASSQKVLSGILRKAYKKDPEAAVKALLVLLDEFDRVDKGLADADDRLNEMRAAKTTETRDFKTLEEKRNVLDTERNALLQKGKTLDDLQLKAAPPTFGG